MDDAGSEIGSIMLKVKTKMMEALPRKGMQIFSKSSTRTGSKNCEYAVLVSLLEPENELYNTGIVDVSHRFPKMFVVRRHFFNPMISLLRNAAMNSFSYKTELAMVGPITNFKSQLDDFKTAFGRSRRLALKVSMKRSRTLRKSRMRFTSRRTICGLLTTRPRT